MVALMRGKPKGESHVYLVRHGKTALNRGNGNHDGDRIRGWNDVPLDPIGVIQAEELGEWFEDKDIDKIYSSDLQRALYTASEIQSTTAALIKKQMELRPWDLGIFTGKDSTKVAKELKHFIDNPDEAVKGGESFNEFLERYIPELCEIFEDVEEGRYRNVVIVAHYRNMKAAQAWIENGMKEDGSVDTKVMMGDDIETASVMKFTIGDNEFDRWKYEIIQYDEIAKEEIDETDNEDEEKREGEGRNQKILN